MDVNVETLIKELKQINELRQALCGDTAPTTPQPTAHPYPVGKNVFIRTVTMNLVGKLIEVHPQELVLDSAAWVAWPPEMFTDLLKNGPSKDTETFPAGRVIVGRGAIVDCSEYLGPLPSKSLR